MLLNSHLYLVEIFVSSKFRRIYFFFNLLFKIFALHCLSFFSYFPRFCRFLNFAHFFLLLIYHPNWSSMLNRLNIFLFLNILYQNVSMDISYFIYLAIFDK